VLDWAVVPWLSLGRRQRDCGCVPGGLIGKIGSRVAREKAFRGRSTGTLQGSASLTVTGGLTTGGSGQGLVLAKGGSEVSIGGDATAGDVPTASGVITVIAATLAMHGLVIPAADC